MNCPIKIEGRYIISISKKASYGKVGIEDISYIAIVYNEYASSYISYDLSSEYQILSSLVWDEDTLEDCKAGIQMTYSRKIEWLMVNGGRRNDWYYRWNQPFVR